MPKQQSRRAKSRGKSPRGLTKADYRRLAEFRYVLRRFLIFSENAAIAAGLTVHQHQALLAIKGFGGAALATTGTLAERLGIRHHSAVGLIDRLVGNGLVRRQRAARDRRQVLVALTPKADRLLARLSAAHQRELRRLAPLLRGPLEELLERRAPRTQTQEPRRAARLADRIAR